MAAPLRALHVLNPFFAGLGDEKAASSAPRLLPGAQGPGKLLLELDPELEIPFTLVVGDEAGAMRGEQSAAEALALVEAALTEPDARRPDVVLLGPAFLAGRYGLACGALGRALGEGLGVPALTALHPENPAVALHRRDLAIVVAARDVMGMREAAERMLRAARRLVRGETLLPERDEVLPQGRRLNVEHAESGAQRVVELLLRKLRGEPFETEYAMPVFDRVTPAPALADPAQATLALVTSGGIVPRGNPDRIESANASRFGAYPIEGLEALTAETHQTVHGGYDPSFANADPNRVLPLDAARALERAGRIGRLHPCYFATVGNATAVETAARFGRELAARLLADGVQAVILTST